MNTEQILAIPTENVWNILNYQEKGVIKALDVDIMDKLLLHGVFRPRNILEEDPSYKQIIPYAVICYGNEVYMFRRLNKQTEARLHNKCSLGVGGHMNPYGDKIDIDYLHHELEPVGFINDDLSEVGKVHLGVLYHITVSNNHIEINETEKMTGEWVAISDLTKYYSNMETWSQLYCKLIGVCEITK